MKYRLLLDNTHFKKGDIAELKREADTGYLMLHYIKSNGQVDYMYIHDSHVERVQDEAITTFQSLQYTPPKEKTMVVPDGVKKVILIFDEN